MQLPGLSETMQCRLPRVSVAKRTVLQQSSFPLQLTFLQNCTLTVGTSCRCVLNLHELLIEKQIKTKNKMGTNYYAKPKVTKELKSKMVAAIESNDFKEVGRLLPSEIHIGKSSAGWRFLFNHNGWEYFKDIESMKDFLMNCQIVDEYEMEISNEDFWQLVKEKENDIDGMEYYTNWDKYNKMPGGRVCQKPSYIPYNYGDEYHFGLRFSTSTEFS